MNIRGQDQHGSGAYRASRGGRLHNGIDVCCNQGDVIESLSPGVVTKIGFPYSPQDARKGHLRYVQVTDNNGIDVRYFYVKQTVSVDDVINKGDMLGLAQGLADIYQGITEHYHFECLMMVNGGKVFLDPEQYICAIT